MTTATWSSSWEHSSDATFRTWGDKLSTELQNCGLVQTGDTGQINWTTVTRPAANTDAGYEIFYLNDSLHGTAPIYIKLYYGTGNNAAGGRVRVEVGTGSNGSGTITGTAKTAATTCGSANAAGGTTAYSSYICVVEGFVGIMWKFAKGADAFGLYIARTVDTAGAATATGANAFCSSSTLQLNQNLRFAATAAAYSTSNGIVPAVPNQPGTTPTTTDDGSGSNQVYLNWGAWPAVGPMVGTCVARASEYALGTTFSVALVGSTARTYLSSGGNSYSNSAFSPSTMGMCMLYE